VTEPIRPEQFTIEQTLREDGATVVSVFGEVDFATAPELGRALAGLAASRCSTVLDLGAVAFMDSSGLQVVMEATRVSRRDGWSFVVAAELSDAVARLFDITRMRSVLPLTAAPPLPTSGLP
jgi:stage II sporulation protein AA (anti-sigma F factor antagonist)